MDAKAEYREHAGPAAGPDRPIAQSGELADISRNPIGLDSGIGDNIEGVDPPEASEFADLQLMAEQLRSALDALTPREATIMAMRIGVYDGEPHTHDETGRALGLTRQRIHQIEKQARAKMRYFCLMFIENPHPDLIKLFR